MAVAVAVAVAVSGGGAVAVAVAGLTKRFFNHIQKDFLIDVWGYPQIQDFWILFFFFRRSSNRLRLQPQRETDTI